MTTLLTTTDLIATKILFVREEKVLLDFDLAYFTEWKPNDLRNQYGEMQIGFLRTSCLS